eukprot:TRINITY_DN7245_c0_g1_i1.p1 TRINITY_DN7245_c0_g1~~TRINITY_DN7245_c0_g1_i1.p1  ORF type:complete len:811 (-),score=137.71 TRINITY_DN7245_c0_g1_i1:311-2743(-)
MKLDKEDDEELKMLLDEIPHATSIPLHHPHEQEQQEHPNHHHHHHFCQQHPHHQYGHHHSHDAYGVYMNSGHGLSLSPVHMNFGTYDEDPSRYRGVVCPSPVSGVSLQSEGSSSSSLSGCDGSLSPPSIKYQMHPRTHHQYGFLFGGESELTNSPVGKNVDGRMMDELGLSNKLWRMRVREEDEDAMRFDNLVSPRGLSDVYGSQFNGWPSVGANHGNVVTDNPFEHGRNGFSNDFGLPRWLDVPSSTVFDEERKLMMSRLLQQRHVGNLSGLGSTQQCNNGNFSGLRLLPNRWNNPFPSAHQHTNLMNLSRNHACESNEGLSNQLFAEAGYERNCYNSRVQVPNILPSMSRTSVTDLSFLRQQKGIESDSNWVDLKLLHSPHATHPKVAADVGNLTRNSLSNGCASQSPPFIRCRANLEAFFSEDSLIIQGKDLNHDISRERKRCPHNSMNRGYSSEKNREMDLRLNSTGRCPRMHAPPLLPLEYNSLREIEGYIYYIAKDQHGCRFLQRKFDEGTLQDVQMIFNEIIDHAIELMMNPFGNYLMQKLLDVCTEEQRMQLILVVTQIPGELVKISLNMHGTRAVQKLIDTLKIQRQISLVVSALKPGFLDLIKDLNGNHVVQRCLQCLSNEDNKFIFDAAAKYCVDIATHRHGCCVLQRCIFYSTGEFRKNLVAEISANGLLLAQDDFGNYVVQYILELKIPFATVNFISQFEGNYVHLSTQKFSSNVVEKCLKVFGEEPRSRIIHELLSSSRFEQLLQDPFANYVIQCALSVSKGPLYNSLIEAIRPHSAILRTSPYCKRIFSHALSKK